MLAQQIDTHVADGLARLLTFLQNKPNLKALLTGLLISVQQLEDALFPLSVARQFYGGTAVGAQLDGIGELVGLSRNGLTDAQYNVLLAGVIAENNSRGDNETLLTIVENVFIASSANIVSPYSAGHAHRLASATIGVEVGSPTIDSSLYPLVVTILQKSIAATVNLSWMTTYDATQGFALAGPAPGLGFADLNVAGSGGTLATLVYNNTAN